MSHISNSWLIFRSIVLPIWMLVIALDSLIIYPFINVYNIDFDLKQ